MEVEKEGRSFQEVLDKNSNSCTMPINVAIS